jgi:hypothetical protein
MVVDGNHRMVAINQLRREISAKIKDAQAGTSAADGADPAITRLAEDFLKLSFVHVQVLSSYLAQHHALAISLSAGVNRVTQHVVATHACDVFRFVKYIAPQLLLQSTQQDSADDALTMEQFLKLPSTRNAVIALTYDSFKSSDASSCVSPNNITSMYRMAAIANEETMRILASEEENAVSEGSRRFTYNNLYNSALFRDFLQDPDYYVRRALVSFHLADVIVEFLPEIHFGLAQLPKERQAFVTRGDDNGCCATVALLPTSDGRRPRSFFGGRHRRHLQRLARRGLRPPRYHEQGGQ